MNNNNNQSSPYTQRQFGDNNKRVGFSPNITFSTSQSTSNNIIKNDKNNDTLTLSDISSSKDNNKKNNITLNNNNNRNIPNINNRYVNNNNNNNNNSNNNNNNNNNINNNGNSNNNNNNDNRNQQQSSHLLQQQKQQPIKNYDRNLLKSDSFPMIATNWENNKYSAYVKFRSYYVTMKSKKYIIKSLSLLAISLLLFYFLFFFNLFYVNEWLYYFGLAIASFILSKATNRIYIHFSKVPEVKMSENERILYDWPSNFPSSPNSHLSPIKPTPSQSHQAMTPSKLNSLDLNSISPIQQQKQSKPQPLDGFISSFTSYDQFIRAKELTSPKNVPGSITFKYNQQHQNKSFEDIERDRINYNFLGRLQTSLTDFSFEKDRDLTDAVNYGSGKLNEGGNRDQNQSVSSNNESYDQSYYGGGNSVALIDDIKPVEYYTEPIQYKVVVQKPVVQEQIVKVKTYSQVIENKNINWDRFIQDNHFYGILNATSMCKRWFSINIIDQLVEPANAFLQLREDIQQQQIQEEQSKPFTKLSYEHMNGGQLDIMKSILKNVQHNLNLINDVHHKRESVYICQRILEFSQANSIHHEFGKGGEGWTNELPTDEQLLFCLFCAYMDYKLYRDITAPNADLPFSSKYVKFEESKYINPVSPMFNISYKRPLHVDLILPNTSYNSTIDISPGWNNIFFAITIFFFNTVQYQNGYLEGFNVDLLNVKPMVQPLMNTNTYTQNSDDEDDNYYK